MKIEAGTQLQSLLAIFVCVCVCFSLYGNCRITYKLLHVNSNWKARLEETNHIQQNMVKSFN